MKYLKWILFCAWWQTHKRYTFSILKTDNPYVVCVGCSNSFKSIPTSAEYVQNMKNNDIYLKTFLHRLAEEFWIQSDNFEEEVFESVRLEWQLPLYQTFLKEVNND